MDHFENGGGMRGYKEFTGFVGSHGISGFHVFHEIQRIHGFHGIHAFDVVQWFHGVSLRTGWWSVGCVLELVGLGLVWGLFGVSLGAVWCQLGVCFGSLVYRPETSLGCVWLVFRVHF